MLIKINNVIYNLNRFDSFCVTAGGNQTKDRISFWRDGDECEYHSFNTLREANEAFDKIPCS